MTTPQKALQDVIAQVKVGRDGCYSYNTDTLAPMVAAFLVQHGQHFAGLEQQVAMAEEDAEWLRQQIKERIARYEAAEARVREADGLLLYIADTVSHESLGDAANMLAAFPRREGLTND